MDREYCDCCNEQLEESQIGLCDNCQDDENEDQNDEVSEDEK